VLRHLHYSQDPLFETLASIHNVHFYEDLMRDIRAAIEAGRYATFRDDWLRRYTERRGRTEAED
jgi:queuine tRNA-ribosyltransferase